MAPGAATGGMGDSPAPCRSPSAGPRCPVLILLVLGCSTPGPEDTPPRVYPTVDELPDPAEPVAVTAGVERVVEGVAGGRLVEVALELQGVGSGLHPALFLPTGAGPDPVFLGLNPCGNQSLLDDAAVSTTAAWVSADCPTGRGGHADAWPVAELLARGYGLVTLHESDLVPDDPGRATEVGVLADLDAQDPAWGVIGAWAWGLSRVMDHLQERDDVDPGRVAVVGHSRRGKAALHAAAADPRFAMAVPHQSGTGGATMTRADAGEPVAVLTALYPHWFDEVLPTFGPYEDRLPVDQHQLLALVAPRPVLLGNADDDTWADPEGALWSAELASPAWELYGEPGLVTEGGAPTTEGRLGWASRAGGHALTAEDWAISLEFADRWL